jgi:hypothetical protein
MTSLPADADFEDYDNYDPSTDAWVSALDWARKGDFKPLAECLRFNPAAPPDQMAVRNFLADVLVETFKKPVNSKAKRDREFVPFVDADGRRLSIDRRYLKPATAIKLVRELMRTKKRRQAQAIEDVAVLLKMDENKLAEWVRNPRQRWGLSNRTTEEMFGDVAKSKG